MMKKLLYIIFLCLLMSDLNAQRLMFEFEPGYGSWTMKGLKQLNTDLSSNIPINTLIGKNYPAGWYYRPSILIRYPLVNVGANYTWQSTGTEIRGKNDTALYHFNMKALSHCPAFYSEISVLYVGNWTIGLDASVGFVFSDLRYKEDFSTQDSVYIHRDNHYKATSYFVEPGFQLKYSWKHFDFDLNLGYFITISPDPYYMDDEYKDPFINPYTNAQIKPQWNGYRVGVSLAYYIYRKTLIKPAKVYRRKR